MLPWIWGADIFWVTVFASFKYSPRSGIARLYASSSFTFSRIFHIVFCSGYTNLQFYQQCTRIPFSPHPWQHLLSLAFFFFFFFFFFRTTPAAYRDSQARGWIRAAAAGYATATATQDPSRVCDPHPSLRQCRILNPLSEARDRTYILVDASKIH